MAQLYVAADYFRLPPDLPEGLAEIFLEDTLGAGFLAAGLAGDFAEGFPLGAAAGLPLGAALGGGAV